jgi:hypothetical protein
MTTATSTGIAKDLPVGVHMPAVGVRLGVKGADAPALLQQLALRIPSLPNRVVHWQTAEPWGCGRCLRQGSTEFLIELDAAAPPLFPASDILPRAWMLHRSEHSLVLDEATWRHSLAHICSFDFERLLEEPDLVVMTLMAGIGVTVIREPPPDFTESTGMALRLWCDASFSIYLQECLRSLGESR